MAEIFDDDLDLPFPFAGILDDHTIANYQLIKERLQTEYIPYYTMTFQLDPDASQDLGKMIVAAFADINKALTLVDKVLSRKASRKELELLNKNITQIKQTQAKVAKLIRKMNKRRQKEEDRAYSKSMRWNAIIIGGILGLIFGNKKK